MCGIIGYIGPRPAVEVLMEGLKRLEYRGYDSAGVAVLNDGQFDVRRATGKLDRLKEKVQADPPQGHIGIGHTRWATHGRPSDINAHPHRAGDIVLIHNGIIENYLELKKELLAKGRSFLSETDTEVVAHLIDDIIKDEPDFLKAVQKALARIRGSYALLILNRRDPDRIIATRKESPLVIGQGQGEMFFASDMPAFLSYTNKILVLNDGEVAVLRQDSVSILDSAGQVLERAPRRIDWTPVMAEKAGYKHFLLKEIFEQPRAVIDTFRGRILPEEGRIHLSDTGFDDQALAAFKRVFIIACGTSFHAALVAKFMIEGLARIPVEVDLASEFRYRDHVIDQDCLAVFISQSGETLDTLGAMRTAKSLGVKTLGICNVLGSSLTRETDGVLYTHAGPEISVASTKAFTTQLTALYLLALQLAQVKGHLANGEMRARIKELIELPGLMEKTLELDPEIQAVARNFSQARDFLYLARGLNYPIALEGALKLKEISYIHAEGYPAGEMKHGPIALIDRQMPVVILAPEDRTREKILGNIEEVRAREGQVILLAQAEDEFLRSKAEAFLGLPRAGVYLTPIIYVLPLQLLAYHVAVLRGTDVDQPRNLAKSVTVE